jgi:glycerophosphoryl diester phosphodiesterase
MRGSLIAVMVLAVACGAPVPASPSDAGPVDAGTSDAGRSDAGLADAGPFDAGQPADAGPVDAGVPDAGSTPDGGSYRNSLSVCWTDGRCRRALAMGHGGLWDATTPYLSNAAISAAYAGDMDAVKIDVRVSSDNVPVLAHSSPIQLYESVDCANKVIETMTAAQITSCHRFPSTTETFQRLDDVLAFLRGKMVAQLTVKRSVDYARVIADVNATDAGDFVFMEISPTELETLIPTLAGSGSVYYLINLGTDPTQIAGLLALHDPHAFMFEFDPTVALGASAVAQLHAANVHAFTYDSAPLATVAELQGLYDAGYDVVSSNRGANGVQARVAVNQSRGISPP